MTAANDTFDHRPPGADTVIDIRNGTVRFGTFTAVDPYNRTWTFTSQGVSRYEELNRQVTAVVLEAKQGSAPATLIKSEKRQHVDSFDRPTFEPSTEVGIRSGLREDIYVVYAGSVGGTEQAVYRFTINPLVWWVWFAGFVLVVGAFVTMWPGASAPGERRQTQSGYGVPLAEARS